MTTLPADAAAVRTFRPLRAVLTLLAGVLFAAGWLAGALWVALTWIGAAVTIGFVSATGNGPDRR